MPPPSATWPLRLSVATVLLFARQCGNDTKTDSPNASVLFSLHFFNNGGISYIRARTVATSPCTCTQNLYRVSALPSLLHECCISGKMKRRIASVESCSDACAKRVSSAEIVSILASPDTSVDRKIADCAPHYCHYSHVRTIARTIARTHTLFSESFPGCRPTLLPELNCSIFMITLSVPHPHSTFQLQPWGMLAASTVSPVTYDWHVKKSALGTTEQDTHRKYITRFRIQ